MLISAIGDVGSGKTLYATYSALRDTRTVYSNYEILNCDRYKHLEPETLYEIKKEKPSLIVIDEAYNWLDSRVSGRAINRYLSYILFQSRKRGMAVILTDQLSGTIDLRFREMTNFEIHCQAINEGFEYIIHKLGRSRRPYTPQKQIMPLSIAEKIYPRYNTWELINPIDDDLLYTISQDRTKIRDKTDEIVKILLKQAPAKSFTKAAITDYCDRNKHPKSFIDSIYNAIKASQLNIS